MILARIAKICEVFPNPNPLTCAQYSLLIYCNAKIDVEKD